MYLVSSVCDDVQGLDFKRVAVIRLESEVKQGRDIYIKELPTQK